MELANNSRLSSQNRVHSMIPGSDNHRISGKRIRTPRLHRICDGITEGILYFMVIFGPWAFGTTQIWSTWVMNIAAYFMGALLMAKWIIRLRTGYRPSRWDGVPTTKENNLANDNDPQGEALDSDSEPQTSDIRTRTAGHLLARILAVLTITILAYCLISAVNARATYYHSQLRFDYHDSFISWLPHSYDSNSSWFAFWQYLGLALVFWATRDWLLGKTRSERRRLSRNRILAADISGQPRASPRLANDQTSIPERLSVFLPARLRRLLWVLCLNGALLGVESTLQRLEGSGKLLWMVRPRINRTADSQFGPYAYRSNAAQYFNLVWPVCLGFWWMLRQSAKHTPRKATRVGSSPHTVLLPATVIMAACPIISTSRGGALVAGASLLIAMFILLLAHRRGHWLLRLGIFILFIATFSLAGFLGWEKLEKRLKNMFTDSLSGRIEIYENSRQMTKDFPLFGTGPGTFASIYQLYRQDPSQVWVVQAHDDWLETRATFGWAGTVLVLAALLTAIAQWFAGKAIYAPWPFTALLWLALAGCLIHARFDFPLQIHSLLLLFLLLCCLLFCFSRKP